MEISRLTRDGTAEPVSRDQILMRERGQGNVNFPCFTDHEQDWQTYPVDLYSCYMCNHPDLIAVATLALRLGLSVEASYYMISRS